jgi:signal transduction histidine kinase
MRLLKQTSIKQRLTLIIMSTSGVSVLLTALLISFIGVDLMRGNLIKEMDGLASIAGKSNDAALFFDDYNNVRDNLNGFGAKHSIVQVCLYDAQSSIGETINSKVGHYLRDEVTGTKNCPEDITERTFINDSIVGLMRPVVSDGATIGYIYVESTLDEIQLYIQKQVSIALLVGALALLVSYFLAINLQRGISRPILSLADTARQVSARKDYSIRATGAQMKGNSVELVTLTTSFNEMLSEIETRSEQLKRQNAELERAKDAAESANRAKSHFLANISHELRTPLNAVIGFSSILMNQLFGPLGDQKYLEYAKDINESGAHLLDIINDILDLSKAEAGKLMLNYEEVHVAKAINKCMTIIAERAEKGRVSVSTDVPKMLPPLVADRLRFIQVVLNVLSNAVKFTQEGGKVQVAVRSVETEGEVTGFVVSIQDTGIGMSAEDIEQAFQSFGQVDSGLNRRYEGTGLGLPLTKKLMELHHGSISIESDLGKGTLVKLHFPALPPLEANYQPTE